MLLKSMYDITIINIHFMSHMHYRFQSVNIIMLLFHQYNKSPQFILSLNLQVPERSQLNRFLLMVQHFHKFHSVRDFRRKFHLTATGTCSFTNQKQLISYLITLSPEVLAQGYMLEGMLYPPIRNTTFQRFSVGLKLEHQEPTM